MRAIVIEVSGVASGQTSVSVPFTVGYDSTGNVALVAELEDPDASPREIMDAMTQTIIANQPAGFDLAERDVILLGLERG